MWVRPEALQYSLSASVLLFPALWLIFHRAGFKGWWALLSFIPFLGVAICAGLLAHRPWPKAEPLSPKKGEK